MKTVEQILAQKQLPLQHVAPQATVFSALQQMADHNVGALVVLDSGRLVGIFSERDYARKVILVGKSSKDTLVREVMTTRVLCARPQQSAEECMALMTEKTVRHLPVLDGDQVVGIVSIGDVVKSVIEDQAFVIEQLELYIHS
jgi:CBS domain-containing protein